MAWCNSTSRVGCIIHRVTNVDAQVGEFHPVDQEAVRSLILAGLGEHWGYIDEGLNPDLRDIASTYGGSP